MKQFDYNNYLKNNPLLKENVDEQEVESYLAAAGFTQQDYALDGVLLTLTNSGRQKLRRQKAYDLMQMGITINESKKENVNEEMSELQILDIIKKVGEKLESLQSQFLQMKQKLKSGDQSVTADAVLDLGLKVLAEIEQIAP